MSITWLKKLPAEKSPENRQKSPKNRRKIAEKSPKKSPKNR
jgi:hypothetical protein